MSLIARNRQPKVLQEESHARSGISDAQHAPLHAALSTSSPRWEPRSRCGGIDG
jgi:hypothetical protein